MSDLLFGVIVGSLLSLALLGRGSERQVVLVAVGIVLVAGLVRAW